MNRVSVPIEDVVLKQTTSNRYKTNPKNKYSIFSNIKVEE